MATTRGDEECGLSTGNPGDSNNNSLIAGKLLPVGGMLKMPGKRLINCQIWQDEQFGELSFFEQALWIGLFGACADDQGRLVDNPRLIRATLWPLKDVDASEIIQGLAHFNQLDWIVSYEREGKYYIQIVGWWKNQPMQWAQPSKLPPPRNWTDRVRASYGTNYVCENWDDDIIIPDVNDLRDGPNELPSAVITLQRKPEIIKRKRAYTPMSEACRIYFDIMKVRPNKIQTEAIDKAVKNMTRWRETLTTWRLSGYNPMNVANILDAYQGKSKGKGTTREKLGLAMGNHLQDVEQVIKLNDREVAGE